MKSRVRRIVAWILQALAAFGFVNIGIGKFRGTFWQRSFERWGYPDGFYMVVGVAEGLGGLLLLVPSLASYAALGLVGIMLSASATHALAGDTARIVAPLPWTVALSVIAWLRWPDRLRRSRPASEPAAMV
jgi:uncharacterized membrane protein YphA (DoxX/SURF4 family)